MREKEKLALDILKALRRRGFQAYFVGGCVRDMVLRKSPADYDIATDARPARVKKIFKNTVSVGAAFNTVLVIKDNVPVEVSTFRAGEKAKFSGDAKTDALNRDFTINALLYDPAKKKYLDFAGGIEDIKNKIIRPPGSPARCIAQDRLRALRAIRFAANLGFSIEKNTINEILKLKAGILKVSKERIRNELALILTGPNPYLGFRLMDEAGMLAHILPEVEAMKGVKQPEQYHPEGDVFTHTMLMLKELKNSGLILALSVLLHDVGKPPTFTRTDRIRFNGHDKMGARMAEVILKRLRFSNDEIRQVARCIDNHMRLMHSVKMREAKLKRLFLEPTFEAELELHRIDCAASHGDMTIYKFLKRKYTAFKKRPIKPRPILGGDELIKMGFAEGPIIGKIHREMVDMQLERRLRSKKQAKAWVGKSYKRMLHP
ncbi:MAG: CCA tRNA nucleotidyltransferase [Candidatus Omnitrophota bacterium]